VPALQFKGSGWYVTDYGKGNGSRSTALAKTEDTDTPPPKSESRPKKDAPGQSSSDTKSE